MNTADRVLIGFRFRFHFQEVSIRVSTRGFETDTSVMPHICLDTADVYLVRHVVPILWYASETTCLGVAAWKYWSISSTRTTRNKRTWSSTRLMELAACLSYKAPPRRMTFVECSSERACLTLCHPRYWMSWVAKDPRWNTRSSKSCSSSHKCHSLISMFATRWAHGK